MGVEINPDRCSRCGTCVDICPEDVLMLDAQSARVIRPEECWYCGSCMMDCAQQAITVRFPLHMRPVILRGQGAQGVGDG